MPNEIIRNVRSSHQSLEPVGLPISYGMHQRAISNHRVDKDYLQLQYKRNMIGSRHEKSQQSHVMRMRAHHMKVQQEDANTEHHYKIKMLYEPETSPEYVRRNGLYGNPPNRQSVNVGMSERIVEYEVHNKYKPSVAALNNYRLHDRQQLSSAAIGQYHSRANSNLH